MTAEQLTVIAAAVLSLALSYVPGLKSRYEPLCAEVKRLVMLGLLVLVVAGVFALACTWFAAYLRIAVACDEPGLVGPVWSLVTGHLGQSIHLPDHAQTVEACRLKVEGLANCVAASHGPGVGASINKLPTVYHVQSCYQAQSH